MRALRIGDYRWTYMGSEGWVRGQVSHISTKVILTVADYFAHVDACGLLTDAEHARRVLLA